MRVGYLQFDPVFGEVAHNLDLITARLEEAEADLLVLPELCASGYQFVSQEEVFRLAEPVPDGATTKRLVEIAARRGMTIVAGLPERDGRHCFNSAVVPDPGDSSAAIGKRISFSRRRSGLLRATAGFTCGISAWPKSAS